MMKTNPEVLRVRSGALLGILLLATVSAGSTENSSSNPTLDILVDWSIAANGSLDPGIIIESSSQIEGNLSNWMLSVIRSGANNEVISFNSSDSSISGYRFSLSEPPIYGEIISIQVLESGMKIAERAFSVSRWNEPIGEHEVALRSVWETKQSEAINIESFALSFDGQGWQKRHSNGKLTLEERGIGSLQLNEIIDGQNIRVDLDLDRVWRNLSLSESVFDSEIFEMHGNGTITSSLSTVDQQEGAFDATISTASWIRETYPNSTREWAHLSASGDLRITPSSNNEDRQNEKESSEKEEDTQRGLDVNGTIHRFAVEFEDVNGERIFDRSALEATAQVIFIDGDLRFVYDLEDMTIIEEWKNGVRVEQIDRQTGQGVFGAVIDDENSSIIVNGTIVNFHQEKINGNTTGDILHVDGTFSGDISGSFGTLRELERQGQMQNSTGELFDVNIIRHQEWLNLSGAGGLPSLFGSMGTSHNETLFWDVRSTAYDNRTIHLEWEETGSDPSSGSEWPERSPIPFDENPPRSDSIFGSSNTTRERGIMPLPLLPKDKICVMEDLVVRLCITAEETDEADLAGLSGFNVIKWNGSYVQGGSATGATITSGPLAGLIGWVERNLETSFGDMQETITENQSLIKIVYPPVVTAEENEPPIIRKISLSEGVLLNEGGSAVLEVQVDDPNHNVIAVEVVVDGNNSISLSDNGLDGDRNPADDVWSMKIHAEGIRTEPIEITATARDGFALSTPLTKMIQITDRAPRLVSATFMPVQAVRGENINTTIIAEDGHGISAIQLDLRLYGGELINLSDHKNTGMWIAEFTIPSGMRPGVRDIYLIMRDGFGTEAATTVFGALTIDNEGPLVNASLNPYSAKKERQAMTTLLSASPIDKDEIVLVEARLGVFDPNGDETRWTQLHDDGLNGDLIANDGIWTFEINVREGIPAGKYQIWIRATDVYGGTDSEALDYILIEEDANHTTVEGALAGITPIIVGGILVTGIIAATIAAVIALPKLRNAVKDDDV